jgi:hypothetical protein
MEDLFRIHGPRATVRWQALSARPPTLGSAPAPLVSVTPAQECQVLYPASGPPQLFEQSDYRITARASQAGSRVEIRHRDPVLLLGVFAAEPSMPDLLVGTINFRNQVGRSRFEVLVDGSPQMTFEVEVFPSKLDYRQDYEQILAEVQDLLTALAFEFLRATHTTAQRRDGPPTALEWALQLRAVIDDLERGLRHIARQPVRALRRELKLVRAERVRHPDSAVRRAVRTGAGQGSWIPMPYGGRMRSHLPSRRAELTLDTPEHRWLADHLSRTQHRLAMLVAQETSRTGRGARHLAALVELRALERRLSGLLQLGPLEAATEPVPAGFSSLQLLTAPGYREASRALIALQLGLRLEGNALELSLKDISTLYEYWCYLAVLDLIAERTGHPIDRNELVEVHAAGLRVLLRKGRPRSVKFPLGDRRTIKVEYNPKYDSHVLLSQQPDIVLAVEDPQRPTLRVVLDAKYRVDASAVNRDTLGVVGPPADALNVLHRYRDAILTEEPAPAEGARLSRSVVYAASLYPAAISVADFQNSRLARQLRTIGVGAVPFLPSNREPLTRWLDELLGLDSWSLGRGAQPAAADPWVWRAASEVVLVGVLRSRSKRDADAHLQWCFENKAYYMPERDTRHGRQLATRYVALYTPASLAERGVGAVAWIGTVNEAEVLARHELKTPWPARAAAESVRLYHVDRWVPLQPPIPNADGHRVSTPRWSSRLALHRAAKLAELSLESPLEWTLFDALSAEGVPFNIRAGRVQEVTQEPARGRGRFIIGSVTITYVGANGFELADDQRGTAIRPTVQKVLAHLRMRL